MAVFDKLNSLYSSYLGKTIKVKASSKFVSAAGSQEDKERAARLYSRGLSYLKEKDYDFAIEALSAALEAEPGNSKTAYYLGKAYMGARDFDSAITQFSEVYEKEPTNNDVIKSLASAYSRTGDYDAALELLLYLVKKGSVTEKLRKNIANIYYFQGNSYRKNNNVQSALSAYTSAIEYDNANPDYFYALSVCHRELNNEENANDNLDMALSLYPDSAKGAAYAGMAELAEKENNSNEAIKLYEKAIEYEPKTSLKNYYRGKVYLNQKYYDMALKSFSSAVKNEPSLKGYFALAELHEQMKSFDKAILSYQNILAMDTRNLEAKLRIAVINYNLDKKEEVYKQLGELVTKEGKNSSEAFCLLGTISLEKNKAAEAMNHLTRAVNLEPGNAKAFIGLSKCYLKMKNVNKAVSEAVKATEADKKSTEALSWLAGLYGETGEIKKAQELYEKLLKLEPKNKEASRELGDIYSKTGKYPEAIKCYKKYLLSDKDNTYVNMQLAAAYFETGQLSKAIDTFNLLKDKKEFMKTANFYLSKAYYQKGQHTKALETVKKSLSADAHFVDGLMHCGKIHYEMEEGQEAMKCFKAVLNIDRNNTEALNLWKEVKEMYGQ